MPRKCSTENFLKCVVFSLITSKYNNSQASVKINPERFFNFFFPIQSSTFGKIPTLLNVDLSNNRLKRVKRGAFGGLASLRSINLENNQLVEIPSPSISLTHLHLANNNITKIKGRAPWPVMNSIIYIDLNNNRLGDSLDGGKCSEHSLQLSKPTMSQCQF